MFLQRDTPSSVMYSDLRSYGGLSNKEAAAILLSARLTASGKAPRDRIESRTYLSRDIVHARPNSVNPSIFADFYASSQTICSRIVNHRGGRKATSEILAHYTGPAADLMAKALTAYSLDANVYLNEVTRIQSVRLRSERDRPLLAIMLFCVTGCLADATEATRVIEEFAHHKLAQDLATVSVDVDSDCERELVASSLGLLRMHGNVALPPRASTAAKGVYRRQFGHWSRCYHGSRRRRLASSRASLVRRGALALRRPGIHQRHHHRLRYRSLCTLRRAPTRATRA